MGPKSALVLPSAAKVIDRNVERIGGQLLHDLMRIAHACLESPETRLRQVFVVESLAASQALPAAVNATPGTMMKSISSGRHSAVASGSEMPNEPESFIEAGS